MGLPRGRRWVDTPRRLTPGASMMLQQMRQLAIAPATPINDPLAVREQLHRDAEACSRRQGELQLVATWPADPAR